MGHVLFPNKRHGFHLLWHPLESPFWSWVLRYLIQHTAHMRQLSNIVKTVGLHLSPLGSVPGAVSISVGQNYEPPETDSLMMFNSNILFLCINWPSHFGRHNMASSRLWFHCHSGSFIHCFSADCCRQPYSGCSDSLGHFRNSWYKMLRKRVSSEVFLSMLSEMVPMGIFELW